MKIERTERRLAFLLLSSVVLAFVSGPGLCSDAEQSSAALTRQTARCEEYLVTFPSPVQNADPPNGTVFVEYYRPARPGRLPAVILLHHYGVRRPRPERELARFLAENGIATAMLIMPYHIQRTPRGFKSGTAMISSDVPRMLRSIEQTVAEIDALARCLRSRPEVDPERIGLAGISLGAVIGALALGQLDEFDAAALVLGGGDAADLVWHSPVTFKARRELQRRGYTKERLAQELAPVEPRNYLTPAIGRKVYMINALEDPIVGRKNVLELWDALGRPRITWIRSGHYLPGWGRAEARRLIRDFFLYRFGESGDFDPPAYIRLRRIKLGLLIDRAPAIGIGVVVEIVQPPNTPLTLDLNLTTGGISVGGGILVGRNLTIGIQRKLFSEEHLLLPYAMIHVTL